MSEVEMHAVGVEITRRDGYHAHCYVFCLGLVRPQLCSVPRNAEDYLAGAYIARSSTTSSP